MKFIQNLLETADSVGLGYYVIDDYDNAAVDGPYKTKAEADKNKKAYYPNKDSNTFSVKYGNTSRKGGHFTPAPSSTPVTEADDEKMMLWTANSGNVDATHPKRTHTIGFFKTKEEAITALKNSKNKLRMGPIHQTEGMSSWLTKKLREDAAVGSTTAGDMAGARGSLFGGVVAKRKIPKAERVQRIQFSNRANWNIRESFMSELLEFSDTGNAFTSTNKFNSADVISKLVAAEKQTGIDRKSIAFGIEDDSGNIVKVYVPPEQAGDFQKVLDTIVVDTAMNNQEIGEILFNLKDKFDIINVEWPALPEDEEETVPPAEGKDDTSTDLEMTDDSTDTSGDNDMDIATNSPVDSNSSDSSDSSVSSALDKVIDMLKADANARTAEANAKAQEAKAKEAEYASKMAEQRVKSEEEVLDMEAFYKHKSDEQKEARKLMKLAKYRHDLANNAEEDLS
jgi:hypothetical protein